MKRELVLLEVSKGPPWVGRVDLDILILMIPLSANAKTEYAIIDNLKETRRTRQIHYHAHRPRSCPCRSDLVLQWSNYRTGRHEDLLALMVESAQTYQSQ